MGMKLNLTCPWQVSGGGVFGFDEWVDLDLRVLLRTVPAVSQRKGAW
jgi:hypothetical protein